MTMLTEEQRAAAFALDKNVLVCAGAGAGKTRVLVERYVQTLLSNPALRPDSIIAMTYTRKAALEMRNRLKARLEELVRLSTDDSEKKRLLNHRSEVDSAPVGTIHSLCESILRAYPAAAGVDPQFQVLDEFERKELIAASVEKALLMLAGKSPAVQKLISRYSIDEVKAAIAETIKARFEFARAVAVLPQLSDQFEQELLKYIQQKIDCIQSSVWDKIKSSTWWQLGISYITSRHGADLPERLRDAVDTIVRAAENINTAPRLKEIHELLRQIAAVGLAKGKLKAGVAEVQQEVKRLRQLVTQHTANVSLEVNQEDHRAVRLIRAVIEVHNRAIALYETEKTRKKKLDFDDQIDKTRALLSNQHSTARRFYNQNLAAILIDEFQDTNEVQCEIIDLLAGPQTRMFLIGDDKQSIYKFQGADVSVFNRHKQIYEDNAHDGHMLAGFETSFRAHPELNAFLNNAFHSILAVQSIMPHYDARFAKLVAGRSGDQESRVEVSCFDDGAHASCSTEAHAVARWIKDKIDNRATIIDKDTEQVRNIAYKDFAVLLRRHAQFQDFEQAFDLFDLPYVCLGGSSFTSTQEVYDLENLLKFLQSSANDHALFGVLRSPLFGFSDAMLQVLSNCRQGKRTLWEALVKYNGTISGADNNGMKPTAARFDGNDPRIKHAVVVLNRLIDCSRRQSLPDVLQQALLLTGYDITISALGHQRSRNVWKLLALAAQENQTSSIEDFLRHLQQSRELKVENVGAPLDPGNSIKIMTIHGAKGLEFPAVILPGIASAAKSSRSNLLSFHREYGVAFNGSLRDEEKPAFFEIASLIEREIDVAEQRRLFYVAASRARDYLGIFVKDGTASASKGASTRSKSESARGKKTPSFQDWMIEALQVDLNTIDATRRRIEFQGAYGTASFVAFRHTPTDDVSEIDGVSAVETTELNLTGGVPLQHALPVIGSSDSELLVPVIGEYSLPVSSWKQRLRVTPVSQDSVIHEVLLGDYFHKVMEYFAVTRLKPSQSTLEMLASSLNGRATASDFRQELVRRVSNLLPIFYDSELHSLMVQAQQLMHEVPYTMIDSPDDDMLEAENARSKRPDLLLQDAQDGWRIVDYKTDAVTSDTLEQELSKHRQQILTYVNDIKAICNIDAPGFIYFAQTGNLCRIV